MGSADARSRCRAARLPTCPATGLRSGQVAASWALEDNLERLTQLGLLPTSIRPRITTSRHAVSARFD